MHKPLVKSNRIFLPPFHIKLGLFKQFMKALDKQFLLRQKYLRMEL